MMPIEIVQLVRSTCARPSGDRVRPNERESSSAFDVPAATSTPHRSSDHARTTRSSWSWPITHGLDGQRTVLEEDGFEPWQRWVRGAERSARRFADELVVASTGEVTTVVRLRWRSQAERSRIGRVFTPTAGDWSLVDLPSPLWPAYSLVRPARLAMERAGVVQRDDDSLGPFLSTPQSLIGPLLDFAGAGPDDRLLDIGCGDGRVVVAAAEHSGCTALGVERSADLVERARQRAAAGGVADRVDIVLGDGRSG